MKLIVLAVALFTLLIPSAVAKGGPGKPVNVYVAAPVNAQTSVTTEQAVSAVQSWLGSPSDAPCIGSQFTCTMEGWFRHELGLVFDYTVEVVPMHAITGPTDACGSWNFPFLYSHLESTSIGLSSQDRSMVLMLGAGGWAGHFSPANRKVDHFGMVGDWGVMQQFGVPNACVLEHAALDGPARGFSHEFAGMMGAYVTAGYNEGGLFLGDVFSENSKRDLAKYSGRWLRAP